MVAWRRYALFLSLCCVAALLLPVAAAAQLNEYAGAYGDDLVWQGEVTMTGDVLVLSGATLTIRAGTTVRVIPSESTKIDPEYLSSLTELLVRGRLEVQGTAESPVRFVIGDKAEEPIAWSGITFDRGEGRISHAQIERADIAVRCVAASPAIIGNRISACRYAVVAQAGSAPKIADNRIEDGEGGIFCWRGSDPQISGNLLAGNDEEALFIDATSRPVLGSNRFSANAIAVAVYPRELDLGALLFDGNVEDVRRLGLPGEGR